MAKRTGGMNQTPKQEPMIDMAGQSVMEGQMPPLPAVAGAVPPDPVANADASLSQLARIEEKAARIEEKFARYEAVFGRAQDSLGRAAERVETAARSVDAAELAQEVANLRARVDQTPRFGALLLSTLLTAVVTTAFVIAVLRFVPGLLK